MSDRIETYETVMIKDASGRNVTVNKIEKELRAYEEQGYQVPASVYAEIKKAVKEAEREETQAEKDERSKAAVTKPPETVENKAPEQKVDGAKTVTTAPPADHGAAAKKT